MNHSLLNLLDGMMDFPFSTLEVMVPFTNTSLIRYNYNSECNKTWLLINDVIQMMPDEERKINETRKTSGLAAKLALAVGLAPKDMEIFLADTADLKDLMLPLEEIE
jgi:hypothetical protein